MALLKQSTSYLANKPSMETEIREKLIKEISHISEYYRDGSPKSGTAIIVEIMATIRGK